MSIFTLEYLKIRRFLFFSICRFQGYLFLYLLTLLIWSHGHLILHWGSFSIITKPKPHFRTLTINQDIIDIKILRNDTLIYCLFLLTFIELITHNDIVLLRLENYFQPLIKCNRWLILFFIRFFIHNLSINIKLNINFIIFFDFIESYFISWLVF